MNRPNDGEGGPRVPEATSPSKILARSAGSGEDALDDRIDPTMRAGDGRQPSPEDPHISHGSVLGTGQYTMAEAARLKGVSYHTVSRAVRRGRLPVQRLGRMALIAADDLLAWTPMKERAPRKYQSRQPALDAHPVLLDLVAGTGTQSQLAESLSTLYEVIHSAASERSEEDFAVLIRDHVAQAFRLDRVVIWIFDSERGTATRLTRSPSLRTRFPDQVQIADFPLFRGMLPTSKAHLIPDLSIVDPNIAAYFLPVERLGTVLSIPLKIGSRLCGVIMGDRHDTVFNLSAMELALAQGLANQAAIGLETLRLRLATCHRLHLLEAILEGLPESVFAIDPDGNEVVSNHAYRDMQAIEGSESMVLGNVIRRVNRSKKGGKVASIAETGMARALAGEEMPRFDYSIAQDGKPPRVLTVTTKPIRVADDLAGAFVVARDITTARETLQRRQRRGKDLEDAARKAQVVVDVVTQVNMGKTVQEVADTVLAHLVRELGGDSGLLKLRDAESRFDLRSTYELDLPPDFALRFNPASYPNTILAFARQTPILIDLEEASTFERETMERLSWSGLLIVPFQLGDEHLGFAFVGYTAPPPQADEIDMRLVSTLGLQCAHALERAGTIADLESGYSRLLTVIDQLPQAVVIVSHPDGFVTIANKAAEALWRFSLAKGPIPAAQLPVIDPHGLPYDRDSHPLIRSGRTGRSYLGEPMTIEREDGETVEVLSNHAPIFSGNGQITGSISILQDRVHFKPLDRVKDEFLSVVAHELRNPLTSLKGNVQLIERRIRREGSLSSDEGLKRVETVLGQVDRIASLVSRLLDISRADLGRLDVSVGPTDAAALVQKVADEAAGMVPDRLVRVSSPAYVPVVWDEIRVEQILFNLLTNAALYAPSGPIEIALRETEDDVVHISVRDHGAGIPSWIRPRLFKQYFRFDDGRESVSDFGVGGSGLGIGLYLSEQLAVAHGGSLEVDDAAGGGAVFTLSLPREATVSAE